MKKYKTNLEFGTCYPKLAITQNGDGNDQTLFYFGGYGSNGMNWMLDMKKSTTQDFYMQPKSDEWTEIPVSHSHLVTNSTYTKYTDKEELLHHVGSQYIMRMIGRK